MLRHAQAGGEQSAKVVDYLTELGDANIGYETVAIPDGWFDRYLGEYTFGKRPRDRYGIVMLKGDLAIKHGVDGDPRRIIHLGNHAFHPAGSPAVVMRFDVTGDNVAGLTVTDGPSNIKATRVTA